MASFQASLYCLPWLLLLFFFFIPSINSSSLTKSSISSLSSRRRIPRLTVHNNAVDPPRESGHLGSYEVFYYNQTLDHFNYQPQSYITFPQRYVMNSKFWRGGNSSAPIFAYMGEEASMDSDLAAIGFLSENAAQFGALIVFIEHRFYGESVPFVSREEALTNATLRGYFNSAQALADYAEILLHIKKELSADTSPIIVIGGSYGGMLAAWFRLKYPHIALGALASSAPVLYLDGLTPQEAYFSAVTKDFREASESCYNTIKQSWAEIERVSNLENGLSILQKKFRLCKPLKEAWELRSYLETMYIVAAQYDRPPKYPVDVICKGIDSAPSSSYILDKIFLGFVAYYGKASCYSMGSSFSDETLQGWDWQVCSDIVIQMGIDRNDTMFALNPFDEKLNDEFCMHKFGVIPRRHWITTYYGGQHIKEVLKKFGSNIIFSNGLRDPYSSGGILEDISENIVAVKSNKGSHCLDIAPAREYDPEWLILQRKTEVEIISKWIIDYYEDLLEN